MANAKRAANRARSARNGMGQREPSHREPGYKGEGYASDGSHGSKSQSSGSHRHLTESRGPGPVPGAGEVGGQLGAPSSGNGARYVRTDNTENPNRKTPSQSASRARSTFDD